MLDFHLEEKILNIRPITHPILGAYMRKSNVVKLISDFFFVIKFQINKQTFKGVKFWEYLNVWYFEASLKTCMEKGK